MSEYLDSEALRRRVAELELHLDRKNRESEELKNRIHDLTGRVEQIMLRITEELKLAHALQRALIPSEFPNIPGFEFSTKFRASLVQGGDYFDIFELEDKFRFAIVLASSSGHTMSALFLSVLMRLYSQVQARKGLSPREILDRLRVELVPAVAPLDTVHVFVGVVDRRNFELTYCQAGNLATYLIESSSGKVAALEAHDQPIGAAADPKYSEGVIGLNPSDHLVLASPFFVSMRDSAGADLGRGWIEEILSRGSRLGAHELRNEIFFQAERNLQTNQFDRDATVVVAVVKDKVIKLARV